MTTSPTPASTLPRPKRSSLENDLKLLLHDEKFSDISLKCSDDVVLRACKNILSVRSKVLNELIFHPTKKNQSQSQIEFDQINSTAMKFILEYLYTSKNEQERLSDKNVVEIYYSANHFELEDLKKEIIEFTKKSLEDGDEDLSKRLLSECVQKFSLETDNEMTQLLVNWVARIRLDPNEAGKDSLSLMGLQYLLMRTNDAGGTFATYELELFEYAIVKSKRVEGIEADTSTNPYDLNYESSRTEGIIKKLTPLLPYIDLRRIGSIDVIEKIEPLEIFSSQRITDVYRHKLKEMHEVREPLQPVRGSLTFKWQHFDDKGWQDENHLYMTRDGLTLGADTNLKKHQTVMGNFVIKGSGTFKWKVLIEGLNEPIYIGVCGIEGRFNKPGDKGYNGYALCSDGYVYYEDYFKWINSKFKENDTVTVIVDMMQKRCFFSVNDIACNEELGWTLPDQVCPFVSLKKDCKLRISNE